MRIKKKAEFIPFVQTLAYRMILLIVSIILLAGSVILFAYATFPGLGSIYGGSMNVMLISFGLMILTGLAFFYNMSRLKDARLSPAAMKRMKRRS
jgi:hypothetical protein